MDFTGMRTARPTWIRCNSPAASSFQIDRMPQSRSSAARCTLTAIGTAAASDRAGRAGEAGLAGWLVLLGTRPPRRRRGEQCRAVDPDGPANAQHRQLPGRDQPANRRGANAGVCCGFLDGTEISGSSHSRFLQALRHLDVDLEIIERDARWTHFVHNCLVL